jgi:hypothetical protein
MIAGIAFLGERPTTQQYIGAALMLAGVVVSQWPKKGPQKGPQDGPARDDGDSISNESVREIASDPQPR